MTNKVKQIASLKELHPPHRLCSFFLLSPQRMTPLLGNVLDVMKLSHSKVALFSSGRLSRMGLLMGVPAAHCQKHLYEGTRRVKITTELSGDYNCANKAGRALYDGPAAPSPLGEELIGCQAAGICILYMQGSPRILVGDLLVATYIQIRDCDCWRAKSVESC